MSRVDYPRLIRLREKPSNRHRTATPLGNLVRTKYFERIFVMAFNQSLDGIQRDACAHRDLLVVVS